MRKRILSILLTLCMLLCLVPTAVFAEGAPTGTPLTQALLGTWLEKEDPYNPNSGKIYKMPSGNYYLAEDIYLVGDDADPNSAWPLIISEGDVTLDLNGYVLDLKKQNICIYSNVSLTDSSPEAEHKFRVEDSGLWVLDETQGTETVAGGVITGGTGVDSVTGILGGGVSVSYGSLTMNGGSLVGCTANNGGGVSVSYGSFTMNSGRIAGCTAVKSGNAYGNGGGVYVDGNSSFTMRDGAISGCTAAYGGGVYVGNLATFNMNDGSIKDCTADIGGGVYMGGLVTFNMTGGNIESCTADNGGGVYMGGGAQFEMKSGGEGKNPTIKNCIAVRAGGVYMDGLSTFNMNDGSIVGCTADNGGGVYVGSGAQFEMNSSGGGEGPTIKNCIAVRAGGGVFVDGSATFTMNDGSIEDCKASGAANAVHADGNFTDNRTSKIDKSLVSGINAGHTGSETDPILIGSVEGLKDFRNRVNRGNTGLCATLLCDIVLNDGTFDADGTYTGANGSTSAEQWTPIGWYKSDSNQATYAGTFDGGGHTIKGLYINRDESGIGLFRIVSNATIKNLTVTGYVKGYGSVGGIVGEILEEGNATIQNCANYCEVTGDTYVGGIVGYIGYNTKGDIRNCANFGTVKGTCTDSFAYVGGIVGCASIGQEMTVVCTACYNVGTVKAKKCAGGLLGYGSMKMDSCYNVGLVEGEEFIGGLVGSALWLIIDGNGMSLVTVDNCYYLDTATKAFGEALFFTEDTSAWRKSKTQFANELLPLLQNGDENSPWTKTGYLAAAGMTLPLLDWQTADAHTHDYQWKYDNTEHWKECSSCDLIQSGSRADHAGTDDDNCTTAVECVICGYEITAAKSEHNWAANWSPVRPGATHSKVCNNDGCGATKTEGCSGGTATCLMPAVCTVCGGSYGSKDGSNHTGAETWTQTSVSHEKKWNCCGAVIVASEPHEWNNGVCRECGYSCQHSGGAATCMEKAVCSICGEKYGNRNPGNHTGSETWTKDSVSHEKKWNCCGAVIVASEPHEWSNGVCRECGYSCQHSGGAATCMEKAVCSICGEKYGSTAANHHTGKPEWSSITPDGHEMSYSCCGAVIVASEPHEWNNGVCRECGYSCQHSGGAATCMEKAVCSICGEKYGSTAANHHTGKPEWSSITPDGHEMSYSCCGAVITAGAHRWDNGVCAECGYSCHHSGGTATCTEKAHCAACGESYGAADPAKHTGSAKWVARDAASHEKKYSCCGAVMTTEAHKWDNGVCRECGYSCQHSGGTATCMEKAVCSICGEKYGEMASHKFTEKNTDAKYLKSDATCSSKAVYYLSCLCGLTGTGTFESGETLAHTDSAEWFIDESTHRHECTVCGHAADEAKHTLEWKIDKEATESEAGEKHEECAICGYKKEPVSIEKLNPGKTEEHEEKEGKWTRGEESGLTFRFDMAASDLIEALVDGAVISADRCEIRGDKVEIELKPEYLETLTDGTHTLTIRSADGKESVKFTIEAKNASLTALMIGAAAAVIILGGGAMTAAIVLRRKKHHG